MKKREVKKEQVNLTEDKVSLVRKVLKEKNHKIITTRIKVSLAILFIIASVLTIYFVNSKDVKMSKMTITQELRRAMQYDQFEEGDEVLEATENVKFSAFFLRDLDGDGYAEKIKGTCKEIGEEDTLYMELNVLSEGYLKDGKITIDGQNFYLQTALPKDEELAQNFVGNNTKEILFNSITNGTQKLLTGKVRSGDYTYENNRFDALKQNINNYSREDNKIILTGIYVAADGTETEIIKEVPVTVDWYGTATAEVFTDKNTYNNLLDRINEEEQTIELEVSLYSRELNKDLILTKNRFEGTIPPLNGYMPTEVSLSTNYGTLDYNAETGEFVVERVSEISEDGTSTVMNTNYYYTTNRVYHYYGLKIKYPLNAYTEMGVNNITLTIPVEVYYEGANNQNEEFVNPYKSNVVSAVYKPYFYEYVKNTYFDVDVGKYTNSPSIRYFVSKQKALRVYDGFTEGDEEDLFEVDWYAYIGSDIEEGSGITMSESKLGELNGGDLFVKNDNSTVNADVVTNFVGLYIANATNSLGNEGWIKVYDDETGNLLVTFTKKEWDKYNYSNYYMFEMPVKHIRIETSAVSAETNLYVYNLKQIDDVLMTETFSKEEFDGFSRIRSHLKGYLGETLKTTVSHTANYEEPYAIAKARFVNNTLSTQSTAENAVIEIEAQKSEYSNTVGWIDGEYLIKIPDEILLVEINDVVADVNNVEIVASEVIENENGRFIKVITNNIEKVAEGYRINIYANITPDPRVESVTKNVELYAYNNDAVKYYYSAQDIYDVNSNLNILETVNKYNTTVKLVSPNSLLTNQIASEYDEKNSIVISPQEVDITPVYAKVDNEKRTAKISIQMKNNYSSAISDVVILGKIPFEGNTTVLSKNELNSQYSTLMLEGGIEVPEELKGKVTVYYSSNEDPDRNLTNEANGWIVAGDVSNWDEIKTFLIVFENYDIAQKEEFVFSYRVEIPNGLLFNQIAYSHHGIYFSLNTDEGKYRTQTESNKLGFRIAEKFNVEILKTQLGRDKVVPGATYALHDFTLNTIKSGTTGEDGKVLIKNLYVERIYEISELKSPDNYTLNTGKILFTTHVDENGALSLEMIDNEQNAKLEVVKNDGEPFKLVVNTEDESKASLTVNKIDSQTKEVLSGVKYKLSESSGANSKILTTDANGIITFTNLEVGKEYELKELKSKDYYLAETVKFKLENIDNVYIIEILSGSVEEQYVDEIDDMPYGHITIGGEKIPTYSLEVSKIEKISDVAVLSSEENSPIVENEIKYLAGAKFRLFKDNEVIGTYYTDENGKFTINHLYQYVDGKSEKAEYVLKELVAPEGYAKAKEIKFMTTLDDGRLQFINLNGIENKYSSNELTVNLFVEDAPSFKLVKKDADTGELLPGVKFAIYNIEDDVVPAVNSKGETLGVLETIDGRDYYVLETDANGSITADLPEGYYKAIEVSTHDKYVLDKTEHYFGVGISQETDKVKVESDWAKIIKSDGYTMLLGHDVTQNGNVILSPSYLGESLIVGEEIVDNQESNSDTELITMDTKGNIVSSINVTNDFSNKINSTIKVTSDGGYITLGVGSYEGELNLGNNVILPDVGNIQTGLIIKYNSLNEAEWAKAYPNIDTITAEETTDGGFIVGGIIEYSEEEQVIEEGFSVNSIGGQDIVLMKYNSLGEMQWIKLEGTVEEGATIEDTLTAITLTNDGGCVAIIKRENSNGLISSLLIKYNQDGEEIWREDNSNLYCINVTATSDGGFLVSNIVNEGDELPDGSIYEYEGISPLILKYNEQCQLDYFKVIYTSGGFGVTNIKETSDGGFVLVGSLLFDGIVMFGNGVVVSNLETNYAIVIAKFDSTGLCEWARADKADGEVMPIGITEHENNQYIVTGFFEGSYIDFDNGNIISNMRPERSQSVSYNSFIISYVEEDKECVNINSAKALGGELVDYIGYTEKADDGGYVITAMIGSHDIEIAKGVFVSNCSETENFDILVAKYDKDDNLIWHKVMGTPYNEEVYNLIKTTNGDYIIVISFDTYDEVNVDEVEIADGFTVQCGSNTAQIIVRINDNGEIVNAQSIHTDSYVNLSYLIKTNDGGYLTLIETSDQVINIGNNYSFDTGNTNNSDLIVKFNDADEVEWELYYDNINVNALTELGDGFAIFGETNRDYNFGNGISLSTSGYNTGYGVKYDSYGNPVFIDTYDESLDIIYAKGSSDGGVFIAFDEGVAKYNNDCEFEWVNRGIPGLLVADIEETSDGGVVVSGITVAGVIFTENNINIISKDIEELINNIDNESELYWIDGSIVKYDAMGIAKWAYATDDRGVEAFLNVMEKDDNTLMVTGAFSDTLEFDNGIKIESNSQYKFEEDGEEIELPINGMILNMSAESSIPESQELIVENQVKTFNIKTISNSVEDAGNISGEGLSVYEVVKYGNDSIKPIVITPEDDYEIAEIKINDEIYEFVPEEDGSITLPQFLNVTENKTVSVRFVKGSNKLIINKVDAENNEKLEGSKFNIKQIVEYDFERELTDFVGNGSRTVIIDGNEEIENLEFSLNNNGRYYFVEKDGKYIPTNSLTYQTQNGGTTGIPNSTANSYMIIDLRDKEGQYAIALDARNNSENNYDFGYATISNSTIAPLYSNTNGRFIYLSDNVNTSTYYSKALDGGNIYYLHLGYRKDGSVDRNEDLVEFSNLRLITVDEIDSFDFVDVDGKYESSNKGKNNTTSYSYIPIDLTNYSGKHTIKVNAEISSESGKDYGVATITYDTAAPAYNTTYNRFINISGNKTATDYSITLNGGSMYYLHFGYYKNDSDLGNVGEDKFKINSVKLLLDNSFLYNDESLTNDNGQIIVEIPYGTYEITELKAPEGYVLNSEPITFEFGENTEKEITIENYKEPELTVHHYEAILNEDGTYTYTTNKVAEDVIIEGNIGDSYTTTARLDLAKYELIKDLNGDYIFPENMTGVLVSGEQEVIYYYAEKTIKLNVNHYIEGTTNKVLLKDGTEAQTVVLEGYEGESYTTEAIGSDLLHDKYELVEAPYNANGTFNYDISSVDYYYRVKSFTVTTTAIAHQEKDENGEMIDVIGGEITSETEKVKYGETTTKDILITPYDTYEVSKVKVNDVEVNFVKNSDGTVMLDKLTNVTENKVITVEFARKKSNVIVHHYLLDTTEKVPGKEDGTVVEDQVLVGQIGSVYYTSESTKINDEYMFAYCTDNATGRFTEDTQEVIYYYKIKDYAYRIEYYLDGVLNESLTDNRKATLGKEITNYVEQKVDGYTFRKVENLPLTITKDEESNVIKVYFEIRTDLSYTVEYYFDNVLDESLTDTFENQTFGTIITEVENKCIDGYSQAHSTLPYTIGTGNNVIKVYYTKNIGSYTIKYFKEGTDIALREPTVVFDKQLNEVITEAAPVIEGYIAVNPEETITITEDYNEIRFYYRSEEVKYTVNYIDKETNEPIYAPKDVYGFMFGDSVIEYAIDVPGYAIVGDNVQEFTIEEMETTITFYYEPRKDLYYTIEYYYNDVLDETKTETIINQTYLSEITSYIEKEDEGFALDRVENLPLTITLDEESNVIKVYYISDNLEYRVEYYYDTEMNPENTVTATGKYKQVIDTYEEKVKDGYILDKVEGLPLTLGLDESQNVIKVYYKAHLAEYTINYYYEGELAEEETVTLTEFVGKEVTEYPESKEPGYIVDRVENLPLVISENPEENVINVYYELSDAYIMVKYLDKVTNEEVAVEERIDGKLTKTYNLEDAIKDVEGYVLVEKPEVLVVEFTEEVVTYTFYYMEVAEVNVTYMEKGDAEDGSEDLLIKETTIKGYVGQEYKAEKEDFEYYVYDSSTDNTEGVMTKEPIEVIFYYTKVQSGICEKHIDKVTGEILDVKTHTIDIGEEYNIEPKEIEGYDLDESKLPENNEGIVGEETIEVRYYYLRKTTVKVEYLDNATNELIDEIVVVEGHQNDEYEVEAKEFEDYILLEDKLPDNSKGIMMVSEDENGNIITETVVRFYYAAKTKVIEKHIDIKSEEVLEEVVHDGFEGREYELDSKEFDGYDLVEDRLPDNSKGTMTKDTIEVNYYYVRKTTVRVEHIDVESGEKIIDIVEKDDDGDGESDRTEETDPNVIISGHEGDEYKTAPYNFAKFKVVEDKLPENANGEMTVTKDENGNIITEIVVKYYYVRRVEVHEKHIDIKTGKEIEEKVIHEGNEGDEYNIPNKEYDGYDLVEEKVPSNSEGKMEKDVVEVRYYYIRKTKVVVEYVDKDTGEIVKETVEIAGHEGDEYESEELEVDGYKLVKEEYPENSKGTMEVKVNEDGSVETITYVRYYYEKVGQTEQPELPEQPNEPEVPSKPEEPNKPEQPENPGKPEEPNKPEQPDKEPEVQEPVKKKGKVVVKYLEKGTNKVLAKEKTIEGNVDDDYTTEPIDIKNYTLDKNEPSNKKGKIKEGTTEVVYYYFLTKTPAKDDVSLKPVEPNKPENEDPFKGELPSTGASIISNIILITILIIVVANIIIFIRRKVISKKDN